MKRRSALLVSPLPPPNGGVAAWTRRVVDEGIPGWQLRVVDTRIRGDRALFEEPRLRDEIVRTVVIFVSLCWSLVTTRPDVVHLNCTLSQTGVLRDCLCALVSRAGRRRLITHYRGDLSFFRPEALRGMSGRALRLIASLSHRNLVLSDRAVAEFEALVGRSAAGRTTVLTTFVDDGWPGTAHSGSHGASRLRVVYVGGLTEKKGTGDLLEVAARCPELDFVLIGTPTTAFNERLALAPGNCVVLGPQPPSRVAAELASADIMLFPSWTEGSPNAVLEAMAAGLPIVATHVGAIPDLVIEGKGGLLRDPRDIDGFVRAVRALAVDPALRACFGARNRQVCDDRFRASRVLPRMAQVYEDVVTSSGQT